MALLHTDSRRRSHSLQAATHRWSSGVAEAGRLAPDWDGWALAAAAVPCAARLLCLRFLRCSSAIDTLVLPGMVTAPVPVTSHGSRSSSCRGLVIGAQHHSGH